MKLISMMKRILLLLTTGLFLAVNGNGQNLIFNYEFEEGRGLTGRLDHRIRHRTSRP